MTRYTQIQPLIFSEANKKIKLLLSQAESLDGMRLEAQGIEQNHLDASDGDGNLYFKNLDELRRHSIDLLLLLINHPPTFMHTDDLNPRTMRSARSAYIKNLAKLILAYAEDSFSHQDDLLDRSVNLLINQVSNAFPKTSNQPNRFAAKLIANCLYPILSQRVSYGENQEENDVLGDRNLILKIASSFNFLEQKAPNPDHVLLVIKSFEIVYDEALELSAFNAESDEVFFRCSLNGILETLPIIPDEPCSANAALGFVERLKKYVQLVEYRAIPLTRHFLDLVSAAFDESSRLPLSQHRASLMPIFYRAAQIDCQRRFFNFPEMKVNTIDQAFQIAEFASAITNLVAADANANPDIVRNDSIDCGAAIFALHNISSSIEHRRAHNPVVAIIPSTPDTESIFCSINDHGRVLYFGTFRAELNEFATAMLGKKMKLQAKRRGASLLRRTWLNSKSRLTIESKTNRTIACRAISFINSTRRIAARAEPHRDVRGFMEFLSRRAQTLEAQLKR